MPQRFGAGKPPVTSPQQHLNEPIASLDVDTLVTLFGPVFQRFIVGPLSAT